MDLSYLSGIFALAAFFIVILIAVLLDRKQKRDMGREIPEGEWLFTDWEEKTYNTITSTPPEVMAKKIGMNPDEYAYSCRLLQVDNDIKKVVMRRILGIMIILVGLIIYLFTQNVVITAVALLTGAFLSLFSGSSKVKEAKTRKQALIEELPRFLDLLQTALYVDLPIEEAMRTTAKHLKGTVLAEEFDNAMSDVMLGAYGWKEALEQISKRYEIDDFSDFVMDLTISYDKGMNIYQMVTNRSADLKAGNLLVMKERAAKLNNTMMIPIVVFKLFPMLAIMMVPILMQFNDGGLM